MTLDAKLALCLEARFGREGLIKMIPQYCTAHPLLRIKSRNQVNRRAHIPRTRHCFTIHGPVEEERVSSALERAR